MWKANGRTDGRRTLTHDKSSHGLWPGELKMNEWLSFNAKWIWNKKKLEKTKEEIKNGQFRHWQHWTIQTLTTLDNSHTDNIGQFRHWQHWTIHTDNIRQFRHWQHWTIQTLTTLDNSNTDNIGQFRHWQHWTIQTLTTLDNSDTDNIRQFRHWQHWTQDEDRRKTTSLSSRNKLFPDIIIKATAIGF
jgi:hypothetical protein